MRSVAAIVVALVGGCSSSEEHCDLVCNDHSVVSTHTPIADLTGDTIVTCINGTRCSAAVFDTCDDRLACATMGDFTASVAVTIGDSGSIVTVDSYDRGAKVDGDVWSISIDEGNGAIAFDARGAATYLVEPDPCDASRPPCRDLMLDL